jgi:hypothetical protein
MLIRHPPLKKTASALYCEGENGLAELKFPAQKSQDNGCSPVIASPSLAGLTVIVK